MKKFLIGMLIASVIFFIAYLFGFHPVAFYSLSLFTAGLLLYNLPVLVNKSEDTENLKEVIKLQEERLEAIRQSALFFIRRCRVLEKDAAEYKVLLGKITETFCSCRDRDRTFNGVKGIETCWHCEKPIKQSEL